MDLNTFTVNYHAMLMQSPDPSALVDLASGALLDLNVPFETLCGYTRAHLLQMRAGQLCADDDGGPARRRLAAELISASEDRGRQFFMHVLTADGRHVPCEVLLIRLPVPGSPMAHGRVIDISERLRAERLRDGQNAILELITTGAPLHQVLDRLVALVEGQSAGVLCSVLLLDADGVSVRPAAGPSLPPAFMASLDGLQIGPQAGSCGTAMFNKEMVATPDIHTDPRWAPYRSLAIPHGLRACWSTPIMPDGDEVLGSFAMYYREVRTPSPADISLIGTASHLAGIAIQRHRRKLELNLHREHLEELVSDRTAALTAAVEQADRSNRELSQALATLSKAQDALVRRDKLAALGRLVAGVAHELNTPIGNSVVAATSLADRTLALRASMAQGLRRSELEHFLDEAGEASALMVRNLNRAATLVAGFKQIAVDHASAERSLFSLSALLQDLAAPLRVAAKPARVKLELDVANAPAMDSYPGPLSQVVTELFENCLAHAFADRGHDAHADRLVRLGARAEPGPGGMIRISMADNGVGMDAATQARVYDPFFTARVGTGRSGLGLHVAHNIVSNILGGQILLESSSGQGSRFVLELPARAPLRDAAEER